MSKIKVDWSQVDWSETNAEIAKKFKTSRNTVRKFRPDGIPSPRSAIVDRVGAIDWEAVDWTLSDKVIAFRLGISAASVFRRRLMNKGGGV